jgi:outer membrane protein assembly factor BamB
MSLEFTDNLPDNITLSPVLISGRLSAACSNQGFLTLREGATIKALYEIKYEAQGSPFREALLIDHLLAVGHEAHFYLFNLMTNETILRLDLNAYFGHLYHDHGVFYVADAHGLYCIDKNGEIFWSNEELGIDGVVVHEFTEDKILGSGEFDPPGGWIAFSIDKATGYKVDLNGK